MQRSIVAFSLVSLAWWPTTSAGAEADEKVAPEGNGNSESPIDFGHFVIDDENPEGNLPTAEEAERAALKFGHMLVDLDTRLSAARERGDWKQAIKYDRALVRLMPERASGYSGLCRDNEQLGERDDALQACALAIQKRGVVIDDFARFVRLVAARKGALDPAELGDAKNAIEHLKSEESSRVTGHQLQCELSLRQGDDAAFEECANALMKQAPDDARSLTFAWSLAMKKGDKGRAREIIEQAKQHEHMGEAAEQMEQGMRELAADSAGASSLALSGHPMMRWLLGLLLALAGGVFIARRLTRAGTSV